MAHKIWNWLLKEWPNFTYDKNKLEALEYEFLQSNGMLSGALKHVNDDEKNGLLVEILSNEAFKTSEIEGEYLNRESIQSSIKRNLGLTADHRKVPPAEFGISEMMVDLYKNFDKPLSHQQLFQWHQMISNGRRDLTDIGRYRTFSEPMQVVSGRLDKPKVHFQAPPSNDLQHEMDRFVSWFNIEHTKEKSILPLTKAGIAHLYFVSIHPFEDGNGRIARALTEKSISLSIGRPTLISLSNRIESNKKDNYGFLEEHNTTIEITDWLVYFSKTILEAQKETLNLIDFLIEKAKFFERFKSTMNERQLKVVKRLFDAGHDGLKGGLSAENYKTIAKTSASTATRDLKDMVDKAVLIKTGLLKSTRYRLNLNHKKPQNK